MKKLGLVGGMGPESTIPYYHDIVYGVQEYFGKSVKVFSKHYNINTIIPRNEPTVPDGA